MFCGNLYCSKGTAFTASRSPDFADFYETLGNQPVSLSPLINTERFCSGKDGVNAIGAYYVYSMTNVRLAEVTLGYDIPVNKWVRWMKGLNVAFVGRNLAMLYGKAPFDPAQISSTGNYGAGIDLFMMPSTRNLGFSVKVTF